VIPSENGQRWGPRDECSLLVAGNAYRKAIEESEDMSVAHWDESF